MTDKTEYVLMGIVIGLLIAIILFLISQQMGNYIVNGDKLGSIMCEQQNKTFDKIKKYANGNIIISCNDQMPQYHILIET